MSCDKRPRSQHDLLFPLPRVGDRITFSGRFSRANGGRSREGPVHGDNADNAGDNAKTIKYASQFIGL